MAQNILFNICKYLIFISAAFRPILGLDFILQGCPPPKPPQKPRHVKCAPRCSLWGLLMYHVLGAAAPPSLFIKDLHRGFLLKGVRRSISNRMKKKKENAGTND